jgi:transcription elongation factor/antiterminator RfaH
MRDHIAARHLAQRGYETYLPLVRERRKNFGARVTVEVPLFPNYLFVYVSASGQWHEANRTPGVIALVRNGGVPAILHDAEIESIRQRERNGVVELEERQFVPGAQVRVLSGPFTNHLGIFSDMNGCERVGVLLAILGSQHRVLMPKNNIEVVSGPR